MNIVFGILGIISIVIAIILFGVRTHYNEAKEYSRTDPSYKHRKICLVFVIIGIIIILFSSSFVIIPTGSTGVKSTFGQIDAHTLSAGFNWKIPFIQSVEEVNNKQQDVSFEAKIGAETKSRTTIYYNNITVTYQIGTTKSAWLFANVTDYKNLLTNSLVSSAVKSSSKILSDEDATNRSKIEPLISEYLQNSLTQKYGKDSIIINKVIVKDADFEKSYNDAIAAKQKAQLQAEKQTIENKKNIAKAEADATVKKTTAEGEAQAKLIKAKATSEANKMLEKSLTSEILKQQYIDKWDGKLPTYTSNGNINGLFNIK